MLPGDLPSTSVNSSCNQKTFLKFRQLSVRPEDLVLTLRMAMETFRQYFVWPGDAPSTFRVAGRPSVNFCQLPMWPGVLTSTSINFLFGRENFRKLPSIFHAAVCLCVQPEIFCQLSSTFCAAMRPSVNFCHLSMRLEDCPSTFIVARTPSVHLSHFLCCQETFRQLPSTLRATRRHSLNSVNFLCRQKIFHHLSMRPYDLPSTSVNFLGGQKTLC